MSDEVPEAEPHTRELVVELEMSLHRATHAKIFRNGELVFSGKDHSVELAEPTKGPTHRPIVRMLGVIDCSCGEQQEGLYITDLGARVGFLDHAVRAIAKDNGWPEFYSVDYDTTPEEHHD